MQTINNTTIATTMSLSHIGPNLHAVTTRRDDRFVLTVWFSYETPIAFLSATMERPLARRNDHGSTTGKHLNIIDGNNKSDRVDGEIFAAALTDAMTER